MLRTVGENIRKFRNERGLTQMQLAIDADIPKSQVGRIERAEINTTISTLVKISTVLDIEITRLFES
ncbi:helix-turn-helix transcriptional regulator [Allomuricauda taeanensis]|uniref:helix-turn-helix domain-containing protein n=1 Tax=Flagellimonas taeanensis TaxID=1005926 RepID=UPI002E7C12E7|nr:helix-turn-helix transcriptional regulator [Allomuricauda taeanensis]MEE1961188.1 helix-turn-helix transcriptional regulator [Allomuricauda taeanensis]